MMTEGLGTATRGAGRTVEGSGRAVSTIGSEVSRVGTNMRSQRRTEPEGSFKGRPDRGASSSEALRRARDNNVSNSDFSDDEM